MTHPYVNVENCTRLAKYLESLPEDYEDFGMSDFILHEIDTDAVVNYAKHNGGVSKCGTAACAVGHGPAAGILFPEADKYWHTVPTTSGPKLRPLWHPYSYLFIDCTGGRGALRLWEWCFAGEWANCDDHHYGAAKRIRYMLSRLDQAEPIPLCDDRPFDSFNLHHPEDAEFYMELYQ